MNALKKYLVALFVVFLHFAAQIRFLTDPANRYAFVWTRREAWALVADVVLLALGAALAAWALEAVTRRPGREWVRRVFGHVFLAALFSGLLAAFPAYTVYAFPTLTKFAWLAAMLLIGFSLARSWTWPVRYGFNLCLLFSPAPLLLAVQILSWPSWRPPPRDAVRAAAPDASKPAVVVVVFDEWSHWRSTENGEFRGFFRNIRELCTQAVDCRQALSPDCGTERSIPRLIFQNSRSPKPDHGRIVWDDGKQPLHPSRTPSLFSRARAQGYATCMIGWYLPYGHLLGDQVDYCIRYKAQATGDSFVSEMAHTMARNLRFWTDPLSKKYHWWVYGRLLRRRRWPTNANIQRETLSRLGALPTNTFLMVHACPPHAPWVWREDGAVAYSDHPLGRAASYERSLRYLDFYVSQIVARLKELDRFEGALVVLTSDHSWREETDPRALEQKEYGRRVPLIIKLPHQHNGVILDDDICTNELSPLFEAVFGGETDTPRLLRILKEAARPPGTEPTPGQ